MAVPRPLLLALIGVVLLAATFMATRNSADESSSPATPAAQSPAPAAPKQQKSEAPAAQKAEAEAPAAKPSEPKAKPAKKAEPVSRVATVERALERKRMVVLAFFQPGADDRATRAAVRSLSKRQATVVMERIGQIGRYRDLIGSLGVSQAPAVVIIDRERKAHVVEGYVDAETLAQEVADARR